MDPSGLQNRLSGGKRRKDMYTGEEEVVHDNHKMSRRWITGRVDENESKDVMNQALDFRSLSADHWMRLHQKVEAAGTSSPLHLQQRAMAAAALHDIRNNIDSSKQILHPCQPPQSLASPELQHQQAAPQHTNGGPAPRYQHLDSEQIQMQMQAPMPFLDPINTSRALPSLAPLPLSFRPPPIFAESELRHSPTSSSSNPYPLQSVLPQRLPQGNQLLPDSDDDRYSSMLGSSQSTVIQHSQSGLSGTSNSMVYQELQASAAWYSSMRELDSQPSSSSRLGRASLSNGQNVSLYSSPCLSDLTSQTALPPPLPYHQACPPPGAFREAPADQHEQVLGDPQSPLHYGVSVSSSSSAVGPKCSSSSMPRLSKPAFQNDFSGRRMLPASFCSPGPAADLLLQPNMIANGSAGVLPDENCFIPRVPPPKPVRTFTKVYKLGSIGRALDVTRFSNYVELRCELARMFNLEGQLDQRSGWQLVFQDDENDILLVGDDPWEEFVSSVRGIRILSPSEVFFYMNEERLGASYNTLNPGTLKQY